MIKTIARYTGVVLFLIVSIYATFIFVPRTYKVQPAEQKPDFSFISLPSGSKVAWKKINVPSDTAKAPIVYLHGGPGAFVSRRSEVSLEPLAYMGYPVYLYDQAGSGLSQRLDNIRDYTVNRHVQDLEAFIRSTGTRKVILYGHSWGAILAATFVAAHPELVERLILSGPGHLVPVRTELAGVSAPDSLHLEEPQYSNAKGNREANNIRTRVVAEFALRFGIKLASDKEMDDFQTYLNSKLVKSTVKDTTTIPQSIPGGGGYYAHLMTVNSFAGTPDPRPALKKVTVPVLILRGQYDNQKWGYVTEYLSLLPQSKLVIIPGAGHSISFDQPEATMKAIKKFLEVNYKR